MSGYCSFRDYGRVQGLVSSGVHSLEETEVRMGMSLEKQPYKSDMCGVSAVVRTRSEPFSLQQLRISSFRITPPSKWMQMNWIFFALILPATASYQTMPIFDLSVISLTLELRSFQPSPFFSDGAESLRPPPHPPSTRLKTCFPLPGDRPRKRLLLYICS